ncbi:hypothetical protein KPL50_03140 [Clostridium sp. CF012]|nr:hypothetical protein [Clostridium sp. CF012]
MIFLIIITLLSNILLIGCTSQKLSQEPPKLTITIGDKGLQYVTVKNKWDGAIYDRKNTFQSILKEDSSIETPYFEFGKIVVINFKNNPPDKFTISDILIDKNGSKRYFTPIINIPFELKDGKYSFEIKKNIEAELDSYFVPNMTYFRGYRITASWGKNECEYAFIIKTAR